MNSPFSVLFAAWISCAAVAVTAIIVLHSAIPICLMIAPALMGAKTGK